MYRLGLVDTLVTHTNTNGVWPIFLVWSPPWLYAASVKNRFASTPTKKDVPMPPSSDGPSFFAGGSPLRSMASTMADKNYEKEED
jgi:hypothetical protein